jgi:hypothetical protein
MAKLTKSIYSGSVVTSLGELTPTDTLDGVLAPTITTLTDDTTITPNFSLSCNFTVTLGGSRTLANPTGMVPGQSGSIFVVQDATGSRTLAFGSYWDFAAGVAPTLSTGANAVDRIDYIVRSSTSIQAVFTGNYS